MYMIVFTINFDQMKAGLEHFNIHLYQSKYESFLSE